MESATPRSALAAAHEQPYGRPVDEQRQNHGCRHQQRESTRVRQLLVVGDGVVYDPVLGRGGRARGGRAGARGRGLTRGSARGGARSGGRRACGGARGSGTVPGCRTRGGACRGRAAGRGRGGTACGGACPEAVTVVEVGRYCGLVDRDRLLALVAEGYLPLIPARSGSRTRSLARDSAGGSARRRAICARGRTRVPATIQLRQAKGDLILGYVADLLGDLGDRILDLFIADAVLIGDFFDRLSGA